jgi:formiminotetrahydrofolate cyclodeaminase
MADDVRESRADIADTVDAARRALIHAALTAYEDAGLSGLCAEGRWEAAVDAMRRLELSPAATSHTVADLTASVSRIVAIVGAAAAPPPSGGSVAAAAGALAAALTQMVAGLTAGRPRYADVAGEMQHIAREASALATELVALVAREAPLEIARAAARVAELGADVAERGNRNAVADAAVAVLLARSVCRASALTVSVNVPSLRDAETGLRLDRDASIAVGAADGAAARAIAAVGQASGGRTGP